MAKFRRAGTIHKGKPGGKVQRIEVGGLDQPNEEIKSALPNPGN